MFCSYLAWFVRGLDLGQTARCNTFVGKYLERFQFLLKLQFDKRKLLTPSLCSSDLPTTSTILSFIRIVHVANVSGNANITVLRNANRFCAPGYFPTNLAPSTVNFWEGNTHLNCNYQHKCLQRQWYGEENAELKRCHFNYVSILF